MSWIKKKTDEETWSIDSQGGSRSGQATSDGKPDKKLTKEQVAEKFKGERWSGRRG